MRTCNHAQPAGVLPAEFRDERAAHPVAPVIVNDLLARHVLMPEDPFDCFAWADIHAEGTIRRAAAFGNRPVIFKRRVDQHGGKADPGTVPLGNDHVIFPEPADPGPGGCGFEGKRSQELRFIFLRDRGNIIGNLVIPQQDLQPGQDFFQPGFRGLNSILKALLSIGFRCQLPSVRHGKDKRGAVVPRKRAV